MRVALLALLIGLIPATQAVADAIGSQSCAEAEVVGRITHQDYSALPSPPGTLTTDVLLLIDFDVHRVRFGPIHKGPLRINAISPEWLNDDHDVAFYLHRRKDKTWWIADCRNR